MSPGTFLSEETSKKIGSWDVGEAIEMSKSIRERHGARPYGFYFSTRGREDDELDSKEIDSSPMYFLGGKVLTLKGVEDENKHENSILISNMKCNGWEKVIKVKNIVQPLMEGDVVLNV